MAWMESARIRPLDWKRLLWTYLVPVTPFLYSRDALASHMRTYSLDELSQLTRDLTGNGYTWHMGQLETVESDYYIIKAGGRLTYLIGTPKSRRLSADSVLVR